jgi:plastocyanin
MRKSAIIGLLLVLVLILTVACSKEKDSAADAVTGGAVANTNNEQANAEAESASEGEVNAVNILGKDGLDPETLTAKVGDTLRFYNKDPDNKNLVVTLRLGKTPKFLNTPLIEPNGYGDVTVTEAGDYSFWAVGYGIKGSLQVTE